MTVQVNTERQGVEISWDPSGFGGSGGGEIPEAPEVPGFPTHPIFLPPYVDNAPPTDQPHPDNELPGGQPYPDNSLPGDQPEVSLPIYLPPYIDNSLPGEVAQKIKEFLTGNLPPSAQPVSDRGGVNKAVQVFAQGMDGDWSNTAVQPNDGLAFLSYPKGFTGESWVEVRALDGSIVDCGTIQVG